MLVFGEAVVTLLFAPAYLPAIAVTYAMALRGVVGLGWGLLTPTLSAKSRTGMLTLFDSVLAAITVFSVFAAAPFGPAAVAWTQAALAAATSVFAVFAVQRLAEINLRATLATLARALVVVGVYFAALYTVWHGLVLPLGFGSAATLILGMAAALALFPPTMLLGWKLQVFTLRVFSG